MKRALAMKYQTFMSRRKFQFICKIQKRSFDINTQEWTKNSITYGEYNLNLKTASVSNKSVELFVRSLDIGDVNIIPGISGVSRTITGLTTLIINLNLKVNNLRENLMWFNDNTNHFVIQFSDDGAPESKDGTMTIGSLTMWNLGQRVRSREFHYLLHTASVSEKDDICNSLWMQHSEEMDILEGNILTINGEKCTVEFQPSADQSWQICANNVLSASATYPSPYANVHKSDLSFIGGSIGMEDSFKWQPPTMESRKFELQKLNAFRNTLSSKLSEKSRHAKDLEFMATNGLRQLGEPRIGIFSERQRPDPFHHEVNNLQHVLHLIYIHSVRQNSFESFINILMRPVKSGGCGLIYAAANIKEHYACESTKFNKITYRLIGEQAIKLARYSYRLVDVLLLNCVGESEKIKLCALAKICQSLRDIGSILSRVIVSPSYPQDLTKMCTCYFNLFALFFKENCNVTVWTM